VYPVPKTKLEVYDCTLREGVQGHGVTFSVADRLAILQALDRTGFTWVEGGWPGANPADDELFARASELRLASVKLVAFGSCARPGTPPGEDKQLATLARSRAPSLHIFGKSWDHHVETALRISLDDNLRLIEDSVRWLKSQAEEVSFGAEHFFDGFARNPDYALQVLDAARRGGADYIDLADTNGGSLPSHVFRAVSAARAAVDLPYAVHCHNDCGLAIANVIAAVEAGARIVEGTINGYGERCGITDLCVVIPTLQLKYGYQVLSEAGLSAMTGLSRMVAQAAGLPIPWFVPYVGHTAFVHKAGVHASGQSRSKIAYQHVEPEAVGNRSYTTLSQMAGRTNLRLWLRRHGVDDSAVSEDKIGQILESIKVAEHEGWQFELAEASLELFLLRALGLYHPHFELRGHVVTTEFENGAHSTIGKLHLCIDGTTEEVDLTPHAGGYTYALREGFWQILVRHFPWLPPIKREGFKMFSVDKGQHLEPRFRVLIGFSCEGQQWTSTGVAANTLEAQLLATVEGFEWILHKLDASRTRASSSVALSHLDPASSSGSFHTATLAKELP
jgi:2-isopropylmalate synthase